MLGTARLQFAAIGVVVMLVTHLAAYLSGYWNGVAQERDKWMLERARIVAQAEATADRLRADGNRLAAELEIARAHVRVEYVEKVRVVYRTASAARTCFTPDVTALLNRGTPIRERVERVGEPVQEVVHAAAPAPAGGTSERAAAEWVATAQAEHAACRAQVIKLVDWIKSAGGTR
jgi:hypothetical protein